MASMPARKACKPRFQWGFLFSSTAWKDHGDLREKPAVIRDDHATPGNART
jgi:hypothetical protein